MGKTKQNKTNEKQQRRRPVVEELEPRILYSADFAPGLVDAATLTPTAEQRTVDTTGEFTQTSAQDAQTRRHELVLVETDTPDYQKLVDDILKQRGEGRDIEVVVLDAGKDGIQQISDILATRQDLSAVHLISHGSDGQVQLGSTSLNFDTLLENATQIKGWGNALTADADLLIYGCDVAQQSDGKALVDALARLTGADVAASDDLTGAAQLGGDWDPATGTLAPAVDLATAGDSTHRASPATADEAVAALASTTSVSYTLAADLSMIDTDMAAITVPAVNDAPVLDNTKSPTLTDQNQDSGAPSRTVGALLTSDVVLIDSGLQDSPQLAQAVRPGSQVFVYDSTRDSLADVFSRVLAWTDLSDTKIQSLAILSHGAPGAFKVGNQWIDAATFDQFAPEWQRLSQVLAVGANIEIFGCDVAAPGSEGQLLINRLASLTAADVFASDDLTGKGGDWVLEIASAGDAQELAAGLQLPLDIGALEQSGATLAWYNVAWGYRNVITIDHTKVAADQTNFPVLISTTDLNWRSTGNGGRVGQADGGDFVFTLADGVTKLDHEIEKYDPVTGELVAWVRLPTLSSSTDTSIDLYYGNAGAADQWNPAGVWDTNFAGIWHLNQGTGVTAVDSTSNANSAVPTGGNATASTGAIGSALTFASSRLEIAADTSLDLSTYSNWTMSAWVKPTSYAGTKWPVIYSYGSYDASLGLTVQEGTDGLIENWINDTALRQSTTAVTLNAWNYVTISRTATTTSFYLNGVAVGSGGITAITAGGQLSYIGNDSNAGSDQYLGLIDEVRVSGTNTPSGARSESWIATEYANQNAPGTFYQIDHEAVLAAIEGTTLAYTENAAATAITATITASDADDTNLASATIQITSNYQNGQDVLSFTNTANITGSWNATNGTLTLSGSDTLANYQAALRAVKYQNTSDDPSALTRTVSFTVNDGTADSNAVTRNIAVTPLTDAPVVAAGSTRAYTENAVAVTLESGLTVTDADDTNIASGSVTISAGFTAGDTLTWTNQAGITASYNSGSGVLTLTGSATLATYRTLLRSVAFSSTSDDPTASSASRTVTWSLTDANSDGAGAGTGTATTTVNLTAATDAPVITAGSTRAYTENAAAVTLESGLTVTDADDTSIASGSVTISAGFTAGDTLTWTNQAGITASYNSGTGVLTLTGSATLATYQTLLRSVAYSSTSDDPTASSASRTVTWSLTDANSDGAGAGTGTATTTVNLTAATDAPVVTAGSTRAYTENAAAVTLESGLTVTDADDTNIASGSATISAGFTAGDTLTWTNQAGITASYNSGTGVLTLTGSATLATYQTLLRSVAYSSTSEDPTASSASRTVTWSLTDANSDGAGAGTGTATTTVNLTPATDAPVITAGSTRAYTENAAAVTLESGLTFADADDTNIASGSVTISAGFIAGDTLTWTNQAGITASYNSGTGVLTLTGSATLATYQTLLRSVAYSSTSQDPTASSASRTVTWSLTDANSDGAGAGTGTATTTVNLTPATDAPVITAGSAQSYTENAAAVTLESGLTVADADDTNIASGSVAISAGFTAGDTLTWTNQAGITASYNSGTGVLTLTGSATLATYQTLLRSVAYSSTSEDPTASSASRTVTWSLTDANSDGAGAGTGTATTTVNLTAATDAPVITAGSTQSYTESAAAVTLESGLTVIDADDTNIASGSVTISAGFTAGDTLTWTNQAGITASYNSGTGVLTLTGSATLATYQTLLRSVAYSSTSQDPTASSASRTVTWSLTDANSDGAGAGTGTATTTVNLTPATDAPVITAGSTQSYTENAAAVTLESGLTVADADDTNIASGSVAISAGFTAGDTLTWTNQAGITASYNSGTGVLTLTGSATLATYQTLLRSVAYSSTSEDPTASSASRTVTWSLTDANSDGAGAGTGTATTTVNLTAATDAPVITAGSTQSYTENAAAVTLESGLTVTDADDTNIASGAVSISAGFTAGDTLTWTNQAGITASYNSGTGVLTLTGSATLATYQTLLRSVAYSSTSEDPTASSASRTVTWSLTDANSDGAGAGTGTATTTVNLTPATDAPVITAGSTQSYTENAAAVTLESGLTVTDADDTNIASGAVSISAGFTAGDTLTWTNQAGITASYNSGSGVLTLTGSATLATYQTLLRSVAYSSTSEDPTASSASRTVTWSLTDANSDGAGAGTGTATTTVNLTAATDAPVITAGSTQSYTENAAAVTLESALTVTDADDTNIASGSVSISAGFTAGDALTWTNQAGITASYNSGTGVLTLTGSATLATYQTLLRSVAYSSTSEDPTASSASRTVTWSLTDANSDGAGAGTGTATTTVNLTAAIDAPVITAGSTQSYTENAGAVILESGLTVADADDANIASGSVTISAGFTAGDTFTWTNQAGITASYNSGTGVLTLTGSATLATYQTLLRSVAYSSTSEDPTASSASRTVTWSLTDANSDGAGAGTGTATTTVNLTAATDAPVVTAGSTRAYTENAAAVTLESGLTFTDADDTNIASGSVAISVGFTAGDTLTWTNQAGITASYNSGSGVLTLTGSATLATYQTLLRSVAYSSTSEDPTASSASRTVTWSLTDANSDGAGTGTGTATTTVNLTPATDAPVITAGSTQSYTENAAAVTLESGLTVTDADDTNIASGAVSISAGFTAGDTLTWTNQAGITASYNSGTGVLTLTGSATLASYQTLLRSVAYSSTSDDPTASSASRTVTWSLTDANSDGAGAGTGTATTTVNLTAGSDAPVITAGSTQSYAENAAAVTLESGLTVTDADDTNIASGAVSISAGFTAGDTLTWTNQAGITASYNSGSGVLTLTGSATLATYQTLLRSVAYSSTSEDPTASSASRTITWSLTDANSDGAGAGTGTATTTVNLTAATDAPVITAGSTQSYIENAAAVTLESGLTVTDADDTNIASGSVTISTGFTAGDTLTWTNQAGITASYNSGSGVLTLTGSATLATYQTLLRSVAYSSTSEDPTASSASRTVTWSLTDANSDGAGAGTGTATTTVNLTAATDAPVITAGSTQSYTENAAAVTLESGLTVADADDTNIASGSVTILAGFSAGDTLTWTNQAGITASYNSGSGVLTLTGSATLATYETLLRSVAYSSTSEAPTASSASRTVTWSLTDANSGGAGEGTGTAITTVNLTAVNDAPAGTDKTVSTLEDTAYTFTAADFGFTDPLDSPVNALFNVKVTTLPGAGTLALSGVAVSTGQLVSAANIASGDLTFTPAANANGTGYASFTFQVQDDAGTANGGVDLDQSPNTITVNVTSVNDAPSASIAPATYAATEQTTLTLAGSGLSIGDVDAGGASVTTTLSVVSGTLNVSAGTTGVAVAGSGSNSVTLTGTVAQINALLAGNLGATADYILNSDAPPASDTLTLSVDDGGNTGSGGALTGSDTATINIAAANDAPTATITPATYAATEQTTLTLAGTGLSIGDVDAGGSSVTATLSVVSGTLNVTAGTTGVTVGGSGSNSVTLTGTVAQINALLAGNLGATADYIINSDTPPASDTLTLAVDDGGNTGSGGALAAADTATINIAAVNDVPTASITPATYAATEQTTLTLAGSGLSITDVDAGGASVTATLSVVWGTLNVSAGTTGVAVAGSGSNSVTLTGTVAQINALLAGNLGATADYSINSDTPPASDTLTLSIDDGGNTGSGGALTASDTATINISAVNDAPGATITPATYAATEQTTLTLAGTGLSIGDVDAGGTSVTTTLSVVSGTLTVSAGTTGVAVAGSGSNSVTLTGTVAQINALLAGNLGATADYIITSDTPPASDTLTLAVDDGGNTGSGGALTASDTATINIAAANDAPSATITPASYAATEQTTLTLAGTGLSIGDVDAGGASVTTTLSVVSGTLTVSAGTTGVAVAGSGSNSVTLTGTVAQINALLAGNLGATADYIISSDVPPASDTLTLSVDDGGNTGSGGALSASDTATINIAAANDAPSATITPATYAATEQTTLTLAGSGLSIGDVDAGGASVTATLSVVSGTLTVSAGTTGVAVAGSGSNSVTLTGTVAQINALLAGNLGATADYILSSDGPPASDTLTLSVDDGGNTGAGGALTGSDTATINLSAVNDAPSATITPATYAATEQTTLTLAGTGLSIGDVDAGGASVTTTLSVVSGTLTVTAGTTGVAVAGSGSNSVTLTGTVAQINALLAGNLGATADYSINSDTPPASDTLTLAVDDGGNTGSGGALTASDTATINISAVNDAPSATITPASYAATEQTTLALAGTGLSIGDVDAGGSSVTTTLSVVSGTLNVTAGTTGVTVGGSGSNSVTLTGTVAQINALLAGNLGATADYIISSDAPPASDTLTLSVDDGGNTGSGGALTASDTATINIAAANDAPAATITPATYAATEQTTLTLAGTGLSIGDVDAGGASVTTTLSVVSGTLTVSAGTTGVAVAGSGSNSVTLTGTVAQINALLAGNLGATADYIINSDTPPASDTLTLAVDDGGNTGSGGALTASDTATINIAAANDAPSATITPATYAATEQTTLTLAGSGLSIGDVDAGGASVTTTLSVVSGTLNVTAGTTGVTVGGSGSNSVTLTGTVAQINALLAGNLGATADYILSSDAPPASDTLTLSVDDGGNTGAGGALTGSDTATINLSAVNDAPSATITPATYAATEQTTLTLAGSGLSIGDVDAGGASVTTTLSVVSGTLTVTAGTTGVAVAGSGSNSVTLTGTVAQINALLAGNLGATADYSINSDTPPASDTLTLAVDDGGNTGSGGALTASDTATINIAAANDAPSATITPATYAATEQTTLALAGTGLSIGDVDAGGASVTATLSVVSGTLNVTAGTTGVTVGGSGSNSVTLTGTVAQINALLAGNLGATADYIISSDTPPASDTLTLSIDDGGNTGSGGALTASDTATINISAVNDAPTATIAPASYAATEQTTLSLAGTGLSIGDVDAGGASVTTTLSVVSGTLTVSAGTTGVAVAGSGSNSVTLTGTVAQINALLAGNLGATADYSINSDTPPASDTLTLSIDDGGNTGSGGALTASDTATINISAVNDAPSATITPATYAATEQTTLTLAGSGLSIGDVDAGGASVTITLSVVSGTLNVTAGTTGVTVGGSGSNSVTLTGTVAQINALLAGNLGATADYIITSDTPPASDTLTLAVDDGGNTGSGGALTASDTATINISAANDAPSATITPATYAATEQTTLTLAGSGLSIGDVDAGGASVTTTLSVVSGTLNVTAGTTGVTVGGSGSNSVTLTGTVAQINALLAGNLGATADYIISSDAPPASDTLTLSVDDGGNTGSGGALSASDTATINLSAVNDAPSATIAPASYAATEQTTLTLAGSGLSIGDVDAGGASVTTTLSVVSGTLNVTAGTTGVTVGGSGSNSVTLTGTVAQINALLAGNLGATADYILSSDAPPASDTLTLSVDDGGNTGSGGALSASDTATINIAAVNDAPSATITPASYAATEQTTLSLAGTGLSIGDVDAGGSSVTTTLSVVSGTLNVTAGTTGVTVGGSGSNSVTLTGTLTQINDLLAGNLGATASYIINSDTPPASDTLTLSVDDGGNTGSGGALSGSDSATINISAVNDAPVAADDNGATDEDSVLNVAANGVLGNDSDVDGGPLAVSAVEGNPADVGNPLLLASGALLTLNADGSFSYDPNGAFEWLAGGDTTSDSFAYEVSDGSGGFATAIVTIDVSGVNDAPTGADLTVTLDEDSLYAFSAFDFGFNDADASDSLQAVRIVSLPAAGSLTLSGAAVGAGQLIAETDIANGELVLTPGADDNGVGYASFSFRVNDGTVDALAANTISIDVTAVNDAPSFTQAGNQSVNEDAGAQSVVGFAAAAPGGGADEAGQLLSYSVSNDNNALFSVQPTISAAGTLSYTLAADANGVATVTVQLSDSGGTANGGVDTAAAQLFTLTVNAVNDAPSLTLGANQSVAEDAGAQSVAAFATAAPGGGADEAGQTLSYNVSNDNNALFAQQPSLDSAGNLTYTSAPDAFGTATVTVFVSDGGGTANGGVDTSAAQSFTITVSAVNDAPVLGANALTLNQGDSVVLTAAELSASDVDNAAATLSFSVSNVAHGRFEYVSTPGVVITGFTQAEVSAGQVRFVHDGSGSAPAYQITVSDGALSAGPRAASIVFNPGGVIPIAPQPAPVVNTLPPAREPPAEDAPSEPRERAAVVPAVYSPGRIEVAATEAQFNQLQGGGAPARRYQPVATLNTFEAAPRIDPTLELLAAAPANLQYLSTVPVDWHVRPAFPDAEDAPKDRIDVLLEQVQLGGMALSVGVVWWASRVSGLLGSLLATAPAWRHIDPLPVMGRDEDEENKWYDPDDRDADANELAIDDVFEGARAAGRAASQDEV